MVVKRWLLLSLGWLFVGLGVVGIFLPLLPTTPFLLLAALCFSRSSERWHAWLLSRPHLGPMIRDWDEKGAIRPRAKSTAIFLMAAMMSYPLFFMTIPMVFKGAMVLTLFCVSTFILTRPSY